MSASPSTATPTSTSPDLRRLDAGRLLAICAHQGVLVHACGRRLRLHVSGPHELGPVLRGRYAELLHYLDAHPPRVILDFETLSTAKLKKVGGRRYAADPTTEVICAVALLPDGELLHWSPPDPPPTKLLVAAKSVGVVAHNAQLFDRWIWETTLGWPADAAWQDSLELALVLGYPGSLEELARLLPGAAKDIEGSDLVKRLNRKYASCKVRPELTDTDKARILQYCRSDVLVLARIHRGLLHAAPALEPEVRRAHTVIQRRGFAIDRTLAEATLDLHGQISARSAVPGVSIRSNHKFPAWLRSQGIEVGSGKGALDAPALHKLLEREDLPSEVRRALDARLLENAIGAKKLRAALASADTDGRMREAFRYCGAHTGRWTGVGMQPQNLPRGFDADVEVLTARAVQLALARDADGLCRFARDLDMRAEDVFGALVRPCIVASVGRVLGVVDYAQIEARVLLWVAGDEAGLHAFRNGEDVYARMAEKLYAAEPGSVTKADPRRKLGKVAVLGLGYGMGPPRFRDQALAQGVDWSAVPFSAAQAVEAWRDSAPLVAGVRSEDFPHRTGGLWQRLNGTVKEVVRRGPGTTRAVGCVTFAMEASDLLCVLPSGRFLRFPEARLERAKDKTYDTVHYRAHKRRRPGYGGLWTEHIVQAIARDLIAEALVRLEASGFVVVLHVHDEVVAELDTESAEVDMRRMAAICEELPAWASGLPLKAEGFVTCRYRKG